MFKSGIAVAMIAAVSLSACSSNNNKKSNGMTTVTVNSTGIAEDQTISIGDRAEKLALAAEQLVTAQSFMYADDVASLAISLDPNNKRAQLIKALVGPAMLTKGILERIKPIAMRNKKSSDEYKKFTEELLKQPKSALRTFLFDGKQDLRTEHDAQEFISKIQKANDSLRLWFKNNKNVELTLHIPAEFSEQAIRSQADNCEAKRLKMGVFELTCDFSNTLEIKINQADIEILQQIAAGMQIYSNLLNAYDLSGSIAIADKFEEAQPAAKIVINELLKNKDFGVLRSSHGLNNILAMGLDAVAGIRWAQAIQKDLCGQGEGNEDNRPGFLFKEGLCVKQDSDSLPDDNLKSQGRYNTFGDVMRTVELALRGSNIVATFAGRLGEIETEINPAALFNNPVSNVRSLTPLKYDKCGSVSSVADSFGGGVFVRGDLNAVLLLDKDSCINQ